MDIAQIKKWWATSDNGNWEKRIQAIDWLISEHDRQTAEITLLRASLEVCRSTEADYRSEIGKLVELAAAARDAFPASDEGRLDRCISAGAAGCPKSALMWVAEEIATTCTALQDSTLRAERLEKALENFAHYGCDCGCCSWRKDEAEKALQLPSVINQCDGCNSGMPVENGIHQNGKHNHMCCTANKYEALAAEKGE